MKENWFAFYLCIMEEISVDRALLAFNLRVKDRLKRNDNSSNYCQSQITLYDTKKIV